MIFIGWLMITFRVARDFIGWLLMTFRVARDFIGWLIDFEKNSKKMAWLFIKDISTHSMQRYLRYPQILMAPLERTCCGQLLGFVEVGRSFRRSSPHLTNITIPFPLSITQRHITVTPLCMMNNNNF